MTHLESPLTPADCDLRDFQFMPLDAVRLRDSDLTALVSGDEFRSAVLLWCASWHQLPAASLPDDDRILSNLAGFGFAVDAWKAVKEGAMRGWIKCSDGRLYHPVVAEKARDAWLGKLEQRWNTEKARVKKHNQRHGTEYVVPDFETWLSLGRPTTVLGDTYAESQETNHKCPQSVPREIDSKGQGEGQGQGQLSKPKNVGSNNGVGTPPANDEKSILAAVGVSSSLIAWERERGKFPKGLNASAQQVIDLAGLNVTAIELRAAYDDAVTERDKASDPGPINAGFVRSFIEKHRRPAPKPKAPPLHTLNDAQLTQVGRECGAGEARVGESRDSYIDRIKRKQAENSRGAAA